MMMDKKFIKNNWDYKIMGTGKACISEEELLKLLQTKDVTVFLPGGTVKVRKDRMNELINECGSMDKLSERITMLSKCHGSIGKIITNLKRAFRRFHQSYPENRLIFHAAFVEESLGESHFISNLSEEDLVSMVGLYFRNCQMSPLFRDIIVKTYECCKKAGIDQGDFKPKM